MGGLLSDDTLLPPVSKQKAPRKMSSVGELCFSYSRAAKAADGEGKAARPSCQTSGMLHTAVVQRG